MFKNNLCVASILIFSLVMNPQFANASNADSYASGLRGYLSDRAASFGIIKLNNKQALLHVNTLNNLYKTRQYKPLWIVFNESTGRATPNLPMIQAFQKVAENAAEQGLEPLDYWDSTFVKTLQAALQEARDGLERGKPSSISELELMLSESAIRYVSHLSNGRFDPQSVDNDIRFKAKVFTDFSALNNALSGGRQGLQARLDAFMPGMPQYAGLKGALKKMTGIKHSGDWMIIPNPESVLRLGINSPSVKKIRARLKTMGYPVLDNGSDKFDDEFQAVVKLYQDLNGLVVDGVIGRENSEVLRSLNVTPARRISQIVVNMEKLRWLPKTLEPRHVFINLATTEFRMFEDQVTVLDFKTINGKDSKRTPTARNMLSTVIFNPTWGVPPGNLTRDKLIMMKNDPNYAADHNMVVTDSKRGRVKPGDVIDIDRASDYSILQTPSYNNALGVVKFPLSNNELIYLHDTNEREIFNSSGVEAKNFRRHVSSGCIRLEAPLAFAEEVLKYNLDQKWSLARINSVVASKEAPIAEEKYRSLEVKVVKALPVYMMYLTAETDKGGLMRFVDDVYGQDYRVATAIKNIRAAGELF